MPFGEQEPSEIPGDRVTSANHTVNVEGKEFSVSMDDESLPSGEYSCVMYAEEDNKPIGRDSVFIVVTDRDPDGKIRLCRVSKKPTTNKQNKTKKQQQKTNKQTKQKQKQTNICALIRVC